jgi:hypothetical protein
LRITRPAATGPLTITFNAVPGTVYRLLGSQNFSSWSELENRTATFGEESFQVAATNSYQFFRVATP